MSFFAVQVRSGSELEVKEMMKEILCKSGEASVKAIHALETFTQTVDNQTNDTEFDNLTSEDISCHLYVQRLQTNLSHLRVACEKLEHHQDVKSLDLIEEYRSQMKEVTINLKQFRNKSKKISSVIQGYILIELDNNFYYLPNHLWHIIKSIPKVMGFPSRMNVPREEVNAFFQEVAISPEVEVRLDEEILSYEETVKTHKDLLHQANQPSDREEEKTLLASIDDMNTNVVEEVNTMKQTPNTMMKRVKAFIKNKRKTVTVPVCLFREMYHEVKNKSILPPLSSADFLNRLRRFLYKRFEVILE